jgi:hypothetical protein
VRPPRCRLPKTAKATAVTVVAPTVLLRCTPSSAALCFSPLLYTHRTSVSGPHARRSSFGGGRIPQNYLVWENLKIDSRPYCAPPRSHEAPSGPRGSPKAGEARKVVGDLVVRPEEAGYPATILGYPATRTLQRDPTAPSALCYRAHPSVLQWATLCNTGHPTVASPPRTCNDSWLPCSAYPATRTIAPLALCYRVYPSVLQWLTLCNTGHLTVASLPRTLQRFLVTL